MRVSSRTTTDGATVVNPQVVCLRLSGSFGTVLSDTDAEAWLPRRIRWFCWRCRRFSRMPVERCEPEGPLSCT
jgi:hypothetical protein